MGQGVGKQVLEHLPDAVGVDLHGGRPLGKLLEVVHQPAEVDRLLVGRVQSLLVWGQHPVPHCLKVAPDVGEGRSHLVGHVGDHVLAELFVAGEAPRHGVEGRGQLPDFVAGGDPNPLGEIPPLHITTHARDGKSTLMLKTNMHAGTHIDAPSHYADSNADHPARSGAGVRGDDGSPY